MSARHRSNNPAQRPAPRPTPRPAQRAASRPAQRPAPQRKRRKLDPISVFGEIFLTVGILALLFVFYEVQWTNIIAGREQGAVANALDNQWSDDRNPRPLTAPEEGAAFARLYIPAFGSDFSFAIVKGVNDADLEKGPGHYRDTQEPGQRGNFAMAGHRVGRGSPFNDLGLLHTCDAIVVETAGSWHIYRVLPIDVPDSQRVAAARKCMSAKLAYRVGEGDYAGLNGRYITQPSDTTVINPVPQSKRREAQPDDLALLTMTTCHPQFSDRERMIVHAVKVRTDAKRAGFVPPEMSGDA